MAELTGMFGYPRGVDATTGKKLLIGNIPQYQQEFANTMHDGGILESLHLYDFLTRQQFAPGASLQVLLIKLRSLNDIEFTLDKKPETVSTDPFVIQKKVTLRDVAKPLINALNIMNEHDTIDLKNMGYRDPEKMMLIHVNRWMVGRTALYQGNKYIVAAINPYEKHHDTIFENNKPLLLINEHLKKAVVVSPYEIVGDGSL